MCGILPQTQRQKAGGLFSGHALDDKVVKQEEEVSEICWVKLEDAHRSVTFKNDKNLIGHAKRYLTKN